MSVSINTSTFPDAVFRQWVLDNITGGSTTLTDAQIASCTTINIYGKGIANLKGIEYFTALAHLYCYQNQLTSLDVSKNTTLITLFCYQNQLTSLDVSKNTNLGTLYCDDNPLTSLDVSKNTKLSQLYCRNCHLRSLDVSKNDLHHLWAQGNHLTSMDVSNNTMIIDDYCGEQTCFGMRVTTTNNNTYPYQVNLGDYVSNISKISSTKAKNSNGETITSSYSNGILMMAEYPQSVIYYYIINNIRFPERTMDVTITKDLTITTDALDNARHKKPYSQTLEATSESCALPITWSIVSGTLPPGLTLNTSTGVISGTPT